MTITTTEVRYPLGLPTIDGYTDILMAAEAWRLFRRTPRDVVLSYPADVRADWNLAILLPGPFDQQLKRAMTKARRANRYSPVTRRLVAVSGRSRSTKTLSTMLCLLDLCEPALTDATPRPNGSGALMDPIPIVWVTPKDTGVKGLVRAMAEFFGLREPTSRSTAEILHDLHRACIEHGTQFVVIDDLHGLRTGAAGESITLLREVIAALPATVVLMGVDIYNPDNGVLWGKASRRHDSEQVRGRTSWIITSPTLDGTDEKRAAGKAWSAYFNGAVQGLYLAQEFTVEQRAQITYALADLADMRYGAALDLLTDTASEACLLGEPLTADLLYEVNNERQKEPM